MVQAGRPVYIIDDDTSVRKALKRLLTIAGYEPECFASGPEFLSRRDLEAGSAVICDLRMPGMNGVEVLEHLANTSISLPFIFITAVEDDSIVDHAQLLGKALLRKPVDADDLLEALADA